MLQAMLDALVEPTALLAIGGEIVAVNEPWDAVVREDRRGGMPGGNYLDFLERIATGNQSIAESLKPIAAILNGDMDKLEIAVTGTDESDDARLSVELVKVALGDRNYILVRSHDLAELNALRDRRHSLAYSVLSEREKERRLIARELHDSTAQLLVGLQLNIAHLRESAKQLGESVLEQGMEPILRQSAATLDELHKELRDLDFLLKPHTVTEQGLVGSLDAMVESFAGTTGLEVETHYAVETEPPEAIALTIYRLTQEALANAQRHAQATKIELTLTTDDERAHLVISDNGSGPRAAQSDPVAGLGVGIASMKERVAECGGQISIALQPAGGTVDVILPLGGSPKLS